ncbi:MAG: hypothetical protein AB8H79_00075 [Myxococcota bacterium]
MTAGRANAAGALFPYLTDDRLHRAHEDVGGWTCLHVTQQGQTTTWEPLRPRAGAGIHRHLRKSVAGDRLEYEEVNDALGMRIRIRWAFSEAFGIVRSVTLTAGDTRTHVRIADGLNGVLPANSPLKLVQTASCLLDAYSRAEWDADGAMGLFTLEAVPSDKAAPAESLLANVVWSAGLDVETVLLSRQQLDAFARDLPLQHEGLVTGRPGAFIVQSAATLDAGASITWHIVADVNRSHVQVAALRARAASDMDGPILVELERTTAGMDGIIADVDGLQCTANATMDAHQRATALFNAMRGGVPVQEHRVDGDEFVKFVAQRCSPCFERNADRLRELGTGPLEIGALVRWARDTADPDLHRLSLEMLPLWFGRRHGDPSRPWNAFSIRVRDADGSRLIAWEGNWRDLFQNWEALLLAYPEFIESVIAVFVNASTLDGHNPYRLTSDGVDWEQPEPDNPWANIGYWGDHQVSYLTRLLELSQAHHPGRLETLLTTSVFSSADVPYRMRSHEELVARPDDAIAFDHAKQTRIDDREQTIGADGRRVHDNGRVLHLTLAEKLLLPVLAKLSALVPGAGIWMNTQRPEWNDANNALAGHGVSVVTAAYLRRHLCVLRDLFQTLQGPVPMMGATQRWLARVVEQLAAEPGHWNDARRRAVMDALGTAAQDYRSQIYDERGFDRTDRSPAQLVHLCDRGVRWLDDALRAARRPDGLFDGYDLVRFGPATAGVSRLYPMLEGQVAILASGVLGATEAADLVDHLFKSALFRPDVHTFILYPNRELPSYLDKNQVPESQALRIPNVARWLDTQDTRVIARDTEGRLRFAAHLQNAEDLQHLLAGVGLSEEDQAPLLDLWEATFEHHAFTGRSGTMHAYEGIGSVYWHMVGKLLLAVQECWQRSVDDGEPADVIERLARQYWAVHHGLGVHRTAAEFGAIPTDPYSHTPFGRGAQQPGMTGLVKEEMLTRRGELGVRVRQGCLCFEPDLLDPQELLTQEQTWTVPAGVRPERRVHVPEAGLGFLICGAPIVYRSGSSSEIHVHTTSETFHERGGRLNAELSARVFARDPQILRIEVTVAR